MANWFVTIEGKEQGPLTDGQLRQLARSGRLQRFDLVRREGSDRQVEATHLKGLFEPIPANASPPSTAPAPSAPATSRPTSAVAPSKPEATASHRVPKIIGLAFLCLFMLAALGKAIRPERSQQPNRGVGGLTAVEPQPEPPTPVAHDEIDPEPADRVRAELNAAVMEYLPEWERLLANYDELDAMVTGLPTEFNHAERLNSALNYSLPRNVVVPHLDLPSQWYSGSEPVTMDILAGNGKVFRDVLLVRVTNADKLPKIAEHLDNLSDSYSDTQRSQLKYLKDRGPPEKDWKSVDWSQPQWKNMDKRRLRLEKQRVEAVEQQALRRLEEERKEYEDEVAALEADIEQNQKKVRANVQQRFQPLSESFAATPTAAIIERYDACRASLPQLGERIAQWKQILASQEPTVSTDGLVHAGGITHLIEGDDHFISHTGERPKVIVIPQEYRNFYYGGSAGPNEIVVDGMFRFVGNVRGRNGLGATVNVEKYVCDPTYVADCIRMRSFRKATDDLRKSVPAVEGGINLVAVDRFLRLAVGDQPYEAIVKEHQALKKAK